jgi:hypothetical protein
MVAPVLAAIAKFLQSELWWNTERESHMFLFCSKSHGNLYYDRMDQRDVESGDGLHKN